MATKPKGGRRSRASAAEPDRAEAQLALREFNRSRELIGHLRLVYWLGAVLMALLLVPGLVQRDDAPDGSDEGGARWLWTLFFGVGLVLMVVGALRVRAQPLLWTVVIACLWSVYAVIVAGIYVYLGVFPGPMDLMTILFVAVFWFAVARAARLERIMREHPEFQVDRRRVKEASVSDGVVVRARDKRQREKKSVLMGRLRIIGIAVLVAAVAVFAYRVSTAPPTLNQAIESFRGAWDRAGADGVLGAFDKGDRDEVRSRLERRGWLQTRPELGAVGEDAATAVKFPVAGSATTVPGTVIVNFAFDERLRRWQIFGINLPDLLTPKAESAIAEFESAWTKEGIDEIVNLFTPGMQAKRPTLERLFESKGWLTRRPKIEDSSVTRSDSNSLRVRFETEDGTIETRWENHYPQWRMNSIRPPR